MRGAEQGQKRVLVVQDVSGVGRCSALAVLPVLQAAGLACSLLPTAFFSTHTGGFGPVHRRDLTEDMAAALDHWTRLGLRFDAAFVGYAVSAGQLEMLRLALPGLLTPGGRLYVDPVMGDHGRRYAFCGEALISGFRDLCAEADLIFPNPTEAALLLGDPLAEGRETPPPAPGRLASLGAKAAVLTGVMGPGGIGVRAEQAGRPAYSTYRPLREGAWPGTGDLLASCVIAAVMLGAPLPDACEAACDFLDDSLALTISLGGEMRHGLAFEPCLARLGAAFARLAREDAGGEGD